MLERFLIVWLCLLSLLAYLWPHAPVATWGDPFVASAPWLWYLIFAAMLALGWLLPRDEMRQVAARWPAVLGGTAVQYGTMPLLSYAVGRLFQLDGPAMIGIVMAGCVPGAMASNVLTLVARGNVSYSLSLTTAATLLSPLIVPWALKWILGQQDIEFPAAQTAWRLLIYVVLPVVAGHLLSRWRHPTPRAQRLAASTANLAILWIIAVVVGLNRERLGSIEGRLLAALVCLNLGGYAAGLVAGWLMRLPRGMRRALTLEVGMQNAGLGATLAATLFADQPQTAIGPATYTFGCMFTGTILARLWATLGDNGPTEQSAD